MELYFRQCDINDIQTLCDLSAKTFYDTFSNMNTPENMKAYLEESFNLERLSAEVSNCYAVFYFLYADNELAGYIKLNEAPAQTDLNDIDSLEIERIYLSKEFQGKGLGNILFNKAVSIAEQKGKSYIWLGV